MIDTRGVIYKGRKEGMNEYKERHAVETEDRTLEDAIKGADVFIGVSSKDLLTNEMLEAMNPQPVIFGEILIYILANIYPLSEYGQGHTNPTFNIYIDMVFLAMANPNPEVSPDRAKQVRPDSIVATGRSDFANQINNVMCFPFLFRGALDVRAR